MPQAPDIPICDLDGFSHVAQIIRGRHLNHFNYVHSLLFATREDLLGDRWRDIDLVLAELESPYEKLGFRFHRVAEVTYSFDNQIMGLYVQSIQERGWEKLRFEVGDYEDRHLRLLCHSVTLFDPRSAAPLDGTRAPA